MPKFLELPFKATYVDWNVSGSSKNQAYGYNQNAQTYMLDYYEQIQRIEVRNMDGHGNYFTRLGKVTTKFLQDYSEEINKMKDEEIEDIKNDLHLFNICKDAKGNELIGANDLAVPPCPPFCGGGL